MSEKELDSSVNEYKEQYKSSNYVKQLQWDMAIGLQEVDNLKPSKYLEKLLEEEIEGNLTIEKVGKELKEYYIEKENKNEINHNELECDFVSTRIVELLNKDNFNLSVDYLKYVHKFLFQDVYEFAGEFRKIDFSKHEKILNNDSVAYGDCTTLTASLEYDISKELEKNYKIQLGKLASEKEDALRKYTDLKELQETAETARKAAEEQAASAVNLVKEKEKTNIMLTEKLRDAEQKAGNYDTLEKENASLKQKVSDLQFKIKDYEKNELLHIKEIEQLKKEAHKNSVTIEKLNTEKYKEHETIQAQLSEKTKLLSEQEKELNVLHIQLAEQSKESELIKERAVIEKEREMLSKIEELRNALDEAKEEKYNLRLQLTKLQK